MRPSGHIEPHAERLSGEIILKFRTIRTPNFLGSVYPQPSPEANPPVDPSSALYGFELVNFP